MTHGQRNVKICMYCVCIVCVCVCVRDKICESENMKTPIKPLTGHSQNFYESRMLIDRSIIGGYFPQKTLAVLHIMAL